jgi:hypothetical protein
MKAYPILLVFLISLFIYSCTDSITGIGTIIQSKSDDVAVSTDTFHLTSDTVLVSSILSQPDSFLLGTFYDKKFGTIKADILAQLNCPVGYKFPKGTLPDSCKIYLSYYSCFGDTLSPIDINIYEINKKRFYYSDLLYSNLNPSVYSDNQATKLSEKIVVAGANSNLSKNIIFKLDTTFVRRFFNGSSTYSSSENFLDFFKGIYITTKLGASTLLNIGREQINMEFFYHYPAYISKDIHGNDSIVYRNDHRTFPASKEVRQVNCIQYPDRGTVVHPSSDVNYIASPANLQTRITLPLNKISTRLNTKVNGKNLTINSGLIKIEVTDVQQDTILHPPLEYILLVKESAVDRIFKNNELPSDTCSILARYTSTQIGSTGVYEQYYKYDIAKLIVNELKIAKTKGISPPEKLYLRLVPVAINTTTNSSGTMSITSLKQQYLMGAVTIKSGKNSTSPMRLNLVFSGF